MSTITDRRGGPLSGLAMKAPCRVSTTTNVTLSAEQTIDGVAVLEAGASGKPDRVLVRSQTDTTENGIYEVSTTAWSRAKDFNSNSDIVCGTHVYVTSGTVGSGFYVVTTADPIVIDTSAITFASGILASSTSTPYNTDPYSGNTGYFGNYNGATANLITLRQSEVHDTASESGGIRNAMTLYHYDNDGTDYQTPAYRVISDGLRVGVFGKNTSLTYETAYKDLHGVTSTVFGRTEWNERGLTAFAGDVTQMGIGVAIPIEVGAYNPLAANTQSGHIAGVLSLVAGKKAAADASHFVYCFEAQNIGKSATAFYKAFSLGTDGDNGQAQYLLDGGSCTVNVAGIRMPASAATFEGKMILYDTGDYSYYEVGGNSYIWAIGGTNRFQGDAGNFFPTTNDGMALGTASLGWADLFLASGGVINFNAGDVTITHVANQLNFAGASNGYVFDTSITPLANDGAALGTASLSFADLFLASGGLINIANGDWIGTHSTGIFTVSTGDLRVTNNFTNAASVVTVGGTQTLTSKTLTTPAINGAVTTSGLTLPAFTLGGAVAINGQSFTGAAIVNAGSIAASGEAGGFRVLGSTAAMRLISGVDNSGTMVSYIQSVENGVSARALQLNPLGAQVIVGSGGLRINQAASTIGTGTKTISNAADGSTNFGKYFALDLNGTTVYVPCGTVAPT